LAAPLQQLFALGVAQLLAAHQVVGASLVAGDAVAGENLAHHPLDAFGVVIDLGYVLPQDPAGYVLRRGRAAAAEELHEHQGLVDVAHAHALIDVLAKALVGGGGGWGHGGILALWGPVLGRGVTGGGTCKRRNTGKSGRHVS